MRHVAVIFTVVYLFVVPLLWGAEKTPVKPMQKDKCPVCGMFVYKYPDFLAQISFRDGSTLFFDGVKDMFKYCFNMKKYTPKLKETDIDAILVTDYYSLIMVDGRQAHYVLGSDVYGPMGRELIPFARVPEAKEFMKDHKGKRLIVYKDVTYSVIQGLD
jgi:copper chaperone NosL